MGAKVKIDALIEDVRRLRDELDSVPTVKEYREKGRFAVNTAKRRFGGSWNRLLMDVFGEVVQRKDIGQVEVECGNPGCSRKLMVRETETENRFCCVACSNVAKPRRKRKTWICRRCGEPISPGYRRVLCKSCAEKTSIANRTIESVCGNRDDANRYSQIRENARKVATVLPDRCAKCGYATHVQVCHRRPIGSFPKSALVSEVNELSNLVKLCLIHHWELDHPEELSRCMGIDGKERKADMGVMDGLDGEMDEIMSTVDD